MFYRRLFRGCSLLCLLAALPAVSYGSDKLEPRAEIGVKAGSERSTLTTEFWAPLAQRSDRVIYTDIRLMGDNDENREGNLGIGYRQIYQPAKSVLGGHLWIDRRRTQHNSTFHQVTLGVESLGDRVDLRANGYVPLNGGRTVTTPNLGSTTPYLAGNGLFYDTNGFVNETPQYGIDAEAGYRLPILEKHVDALRIYGGGYHFFRSGTENVTGIRLRTEAQINRLVSVGARFQHDEPRGSQGFIEATLRFPFSAKKLYQTEKLCSRLDESPERDIDIVTASKVDTGLRKQIVTTDASGNAVEQRILYVDNTNTQTGDGTKENPFNNLKTAEAALQANDILYVFRGDGTTTGMDQGINISQSGVKLIGSGSALTLNGFTFLNAGLAPTITNTQTTVDEFTGNGINLNSANLTIEGLRINGVQNIGVAMLLSNAEIGDVTIRNITVDNSIFSAMRLYMNDNSRVGRVSIENTDISHNGSGGLTIRGSNGTVINEIALSNIRSNNNINGIQLNANTNVIFNKIIADNISASNNSGIGFNIISQINSAINDVQVANSVANNNGDIGIRSSVAQTSVINNSNYWNIQANGNVNEGVSIQARNGSSMGNLNINNVSASSNGTAGLQIITSNTGTIIGQTNLSNIVATGNGEGIALVLSAGAMTNTIIQDSVTAGNSNYGVRLSSAGALSNTTINNLYSSGNGIAGIYTYATSGGTISNTQITNTVANSNGQYGIFLRTNNASSTIDGLQISNSIMNSNALYGLYTQAGSAGSTIDRVSVFNSDMLNNQSYGAYLLKSSSTAISNIDLGGGAMGSIGQNRIFGNATLDIRANYTGGGTVSATNNWWGNAAGLQPARYTVNGGTSITATPFLNTDPRP